MHETWCDVDRPVFCHNGDHGTCCRGTGCELNLQLLSYKSDTYTLPLEHCTHVRRLLHTRSVDSEAAVAVVLRQLLRASAGEGDRYTYMVISLYQSDCAGMLLTPFWCFVQYRWMCFYARFYIRWRDRLDRCNWCSWQYWMVRLVVISLSSVLWV